MPQRWWVPIHRVRGWVLGVDPHPQGASGRWLRGCMGGGGDPPAPHPSEMQGWRHTRKTMLKGAEVTETASR